MQNAKEESPKATSFLHSAFCISAFVTYLPPIMRESLVGLRHLVRIFLLLDRVAAVVCGIHDLARELVLHRLFAAAGGAADQPANRQGGAAGGPHFDRHLVVRTADAAALHFQRR